MTPTEAPTPARAAPRWQGRWQRSRLRRSLKWRLVGLFLLLALATTVVFIGGAQRLLRAGWQDYARPLVADYVDRLAADIGSPPDVAKAEAFTRRLPLRIRIEGPRVNWSSQPAVADEHESARDRGDGTERRRRWRDPLAGEGGDWLLSRTTADGHRISFGLSDVGAHDRPRLVGWTTLALLLLLTALAYAVVRRLLRPLDDIRAGAVRFGEGDFSQPIRPRRSDELGELAEQINTMASELRHRLDAKRGLLLAISHELRSPLTRARVNAELVEEGAARDALLHDLAEMRDLVADLLESERLATGHAALQTEATDLNALVADVIAAHFADQGIAVHASPGLPPLALDRARLRLLLRNLLGNALRHGGDAAGRPSVATALDADAVRLIVRDHGPGVPEEQLARLAEPFYRPDAARQRSTGGVGLGLYLCRLVAQAHGGRLELRNAHPGLEVTLHLPRG